MAAPIEIVSVPDVQVAKVQPERSTEVPALVLTTRAWAEAVPVIATVVDILPAPNWAALNVAVDVPEVLTKVIASKSRKPATPSVAAALRSTLVPAPTVPIWMTSMPGSPPALNVSVALTVPVATMNVSLAVVPLNVSVPAVAVKLASTPAKAATPDGVSGGGGDTPAGTSSSHCPARSAAPTRRVDARTGAPSASPSAATKTAPSGPRAVSQHQRRSSPAAESARRRSARSSA